MWHCRIYDNEYGWRTVARFHTESEALAAWNYLGNWCHWERNATVFFAE